jgi:hypothetical protein
MQSLMTPAHERRPHSIRPSDESTSAAAPDLAPAVRKVSQALRSCTHRRLCRVNVSAQDGRVVLAGRLPSYFLKQLAQSVAMRASERIEIRNEVQVC